MTNVIIFISVLMLTCAATQAEPVLSDPTRPLHFAASSQAKHYTLTSIFRKPDGSSAIVNGRLITVGQTVDGMQLVSVAESSATIKTDSGLRTLTMHRAIKR